MTNCYWPLLRLASERNIPIGLEATGYTLEEINKIDPNWIIELRALIKAKKVEFVGSGYAQIIGPLVPPRIMKMNLGFGQDVYYRLLNTRPRIALTNEQVFAPGLISHYNDADYEAIVIDWADSASHNPDWPAETGDRPQTIVNHRGDQTKVLWSDAIAFQKMQRYCHGELSREEYTHWLEIIAARGAKALCIYGSDAETFDFRPGRFADEASQAGIGEWERLGELWNALQADDKYQFALPSEVLAQHPPERNDEALRVVTAASPITVKKQRKYNIARWAVTGRGDIAINTACHRIYSHYASTGPGPEKWRELCYLWGSDFRTHITQKRWDTYISRLDELVRGLPVGKPIAPPTHNTETPSLFKVSSHGRFLTITGEHMALRLNTARGLAIDRFSPTKSDSEKWEDIANRDFWVGTLHHGYFDDISWGADFYSGHLTYDKPLHSKITDLCRVEPTVSENAATGALFLRADISTPSGTIKKTIEVQPGNPQILIHYELPQPFMEAGSLRLGHVTVNADIFDWDSLFFASHNGWFYADRHDVDGQSFDHGAPMSSLISAGFGMGMTKGRLVMGDKERQVIITMPRTQGASLGLIQSQKIRDSYFFRASLSLREMDDTAKQDMCKEALELLPLNFSIGIELTDSSQWRE